MNAWNKISRTSPKRQQQQKQQKAQKQVFKKREETRQKSRDLGIPETINYEQPDYRGKSSSRTITYKWESNLLKDLSQKRYGRNYVDKFNNWAAEQGLSPSEAIEFRRYMDAKEDNVKTADFNLKSAVRKQYRLDEENRDFWKNEIKYEDGNPKFPNELSFRESLGHHKNYKDKNIIDSVKLAFSNLRRKDDDEDEAVGKIDRFGMGSTAKSSSKPTTPTSGGKIGIQNQGKKSSKSNKPNELALAAKAAYQFFNPFDDVSMGDAVDNYLNRTQLKEADNPIRRHTNRAVDAASGGIMSNLQARQNGGKMPDYTDSTGRSWGEDKLGFLADMASTGLGYALPGAAAYKALNATKAGTALTQFGNKGIGQRLASEGAKGAIIGGGMAAGEVVNREALNGQAYTAMDNLKHIGYGTALGAVADPAIFAAGKGVKKGFQKAADFSNEKRGIYDNVRATLPNEARPSDSVINSLPRVEPEQPLDVLTPNNPFNVLARQQQAPQLPNAAEIIRGANQRNAAFPTQNEPYLKQALDTAAQLKAFDNFEADRTMRAKVENDLLETLNKEREEAIEAHFQFLKDQLKNRKGREQGQTFFDEEGYAIDRVGRISHNPQWYQEFHAQFKKMPNQKELREIATRHVDSGYQEGPDFIPGWKPRSLQSLDDALDQLAERMRTHPEETQQVLEQMSALEQAREALHRNITNVLSRQNRPTEPPINQTTQTLPHDVPPINQQAQTLPQQELPTEPPKNQLTQTLPKPKSLEQAKSDYRLAVNQLDHYRRILAENPNYKTGNGKPIQQAIEEWTSYVEQMKKYVDEMENEVPSKSFDNLQNPKNKPEQASVPQEDITLPDGRKADMTNVRYLERMVAENEAKLAKAKESSNQTTIDHYQSRVDKYKAELEAAKQRPQFQTADEWKAEHGYSGQKPSAEPEQPNKNLDNLNKENVAADKASEREKNINETKADLTEKEIKFKIGNLEGNLKSARKINDTARIEQFETKLNLYKDLDSKRAVDVNSVESIDAEIAVLKHERKFHEDVLAKLKSIKKPSNKRQHGNNVNHEEIWIERYNRAIANAEKRKNTPSTEQGELRPLGEHRKKLDAIKKENVTNKKVNPLTETLKQEAKTLSESLEKLEIYTPEGATTAINTLEARVAELEQRKATLKTKRDQSIVDREIKKLRGSIDANRKNLEEMTPKDAPTEAAKPKPGRPKQNMAETLKNKIPEEYRDETPLQKQERLVNEQKEIVANDPSAKNQDKLKQLESAFERMKKAEAKKTAQNVGPRAKELQKNIETYQRHIDDAQGIIDFEKQKQAKWPKRAEEWQPTIDQFQAEINRNKQWLDAAQKELDELNGTKTESDAIKEMVDWNVDDILKRDSGPKDNSKPPMPIKQYKPDAVKNGIKEMESMLRDAEARNNVSEANYLKRKIAESKAILAEIESPGKGIYTKTMDEYDATVAKEESKPSENRVKSDYEKELEAEISDLNTMIKNAEAEGNTNLVNKLKDELSEAEAELRAELKFGDTQEMREIFLPFREQNTNRKFKQNMSWLERLKNNRKRKRGEEFVEEAITRKELIQSIERYMDVPVRYGRLGKGKGPEVKGIFRIHNEVVRSREYGDVQVISHEVGHFLDKKFKMLDNISSKFDDELMPLGEKTSGKDYKPEQIRAEGIAEFIRLLLTDPNTAKNQAPKFADFFEGTLDAKTKRGFEMVSYNVSRWIDQGPELQLSGQIDRTGKKDKKTGSLYSKFVDKGDYLKKLDKKYNAKKVKGWRGKEKKVLQDAKDSAYKTYATAQGAARIAELESKKLEKIFDEVHKSGYSMIEAEDYAVAMRAHDMEYQGLRFSEKMLEDAKQLVEEFSGDFKKFARVQYNNRVGKGADKFDSLSPKAQDDFVTKLKYEAIDRIDSKYKVKLDDLQKEGLFRGEELELTPKQIEDFIDAYRIESGLTQKRINAVIEKFADDPKMNYIQKELVDYNDNLLQMLVREGWVTKDAYNEMREKFPNYVPFARELPDDLSGGLGHAQGYADLLNPVKQMKGSTLDIVSPFETMLKNTYSMIINVERNKVGKQLLKLASRIEGTGKEIEILDGNSSVAKEGILTVWNGGKKVQLKVDKELYATLKDLDTDTSNWIVNTLAKPAGWLRTGATSTPEFMLKNPIMDVLTATVTSKYGFNPLVDLPAGLYGVIKGRRGKNAMYDEWIRDGGAFGNTISQDRDYLRDSLRKLAKADKGWQKYTNPKEWGVVLYKVLQNLSEMSEETVKYGEYRNIRKFAEKKQKKADQLTALNKPLPEKYKDIPSRQEAAYESRDVMDYQRMGSNMKQFNRVTTFLNATIQGKDKLARAFKDRPLATTAKAIGMITAPTVAISVYQDIAANDKQRELIDNARDWERDLFWFIPIPSSDDVARLPKPHDLAQVFANPVEKMITDMRKDDPEAWSAFVKRQSKSLVEMPFMLSAITPVLEATANYSYFTERPIVPQSEQGLPKKEQYGPTSSLLARQIGSALNVSPRKVDHMFRGYLGGSGTYITSAYGTAASALGNDTLPPNAAKKATEAPGIRTFFLNEPSAGGGKFMDDLYNKQKKLQQISKEERTGKQAGDYTKLNKATKDLKEMRSEYRDIQADRNMDKQTKRKRLDEISDKMRKLSKDTLKQVD